MTDAARANLAAGLADRYRIERELGSGGAAMLGAIGYGRGVPA